MAKLSVGAEKRTRTPSGLVTASSTLLYPTTELERSSECESETTESPRTSAAGTCPNVSSSCSSAGNPAASSPAVFSPAVLLPAVSSREGFVEGFDSSYASTSAAGYARPYVSGDRNALATSSPSADAMPATDARGSASIALTMRSPGRIPPWCRLLAFIFVLCPSLSGPRWGKPPAPRPRRCCGCWPGVLVCWCESHLGRSPPGGRCACESSSAPASAEEDGSWSGGRLYRGLAPAPPPALGRLLRR
mmetsp:Transcript_6484/g.26950  ORF Transcript_6484/g.26950 Transcript_6484/m.26950 type:complete len:248 (+) Transcript_6484:1363-2106(+)